MKIRRIDIMSDLPELISGTNQFVERFLAKQLVTSSENRLQEIGEFLSVLEGFEAFVVVLDDRIVGAVGFVVTPYLWNPELIICEEMLFWCLDDAPPMTSLALIRHLERCAEERGADAIIMHAIDGVERRFSNFLTRRNYQPIQTTLVRKI
jgi:hypothetical protein